MADASLSSYLEAIGGPLVSTPEAWNSRLSNREARDNLSRDHHAQDNVHLRKTATFAFARFARTETAIASRRADAEPAGSPSSKS